MNRSYQSWLEEALSYERSRLTTTPPEFGHGPLPFLRANSGVSARRSIETFVAEAATIRSNLEAAYPQR